MHPEVKAYLDDYHARTMARYDAVDRQYALMLKILTGVSTPQPACPMAMATDDGLTDDSSVPAVVPDTSSSTTKAQETMELTPGASPASIEMVPVTCSTECSTQVIAVTHVDEVHDATRTVRPELAVDINDKEVEQLTSAWAPPTISTSTSLNKEVAPPVATTIVIDPKAGVQELDTSPLFAFDTSTPGTSELDQGVILVAPNNPTTPAPTRCSTESPVPAGDWVKHLSALNYGALHVAKSTTWCLLPGWQGIKQRPWPPPVQVQINHMFRPRPWPSFKYHSDVGYPEESHPVPCCQLISRVEAFSCLQVVQFWQYLPDDTWLQPWHFWQFHFAHAGLSDPGIPILSASVNKPEAARESLCRGLLSHEADDQRHVFKLFLIVRVNCKVPWPLFDRCQLPATSAQDTPDVQLPVYRSVPGYPDDLTVTNVGGMLKPTAEDDCNKGVLVKDSALDFSWEARPEQQEDVCNRESATEVPTNYQVSSIKNPFNLDDSRSGDLLELASGYHLKVPNVSESEQELDSTPPTVFNQIGVADEHRNTKGDHKQDSSGCCFLLAICAPCVRDQHKVNFSTSTNVLISPLSQQLDHNFGAESIFELLLHILQQTSYFKFTLADHKLDNSDSWLDEHHWSFHGTDVDTCKCDTIQALIEESGQCFSQFTKIKWRFRNCLKMMTHCMVLLPCVNIDYELWRPPSRRKIVKLQSGLLVKFRRLQLLLVSSLKLQPKPAWQLTLLVTAGLSNCCYEKVLPTLKNSANTSMLLCFSCHTITSPIVGSARIQDITMASCPGFVVNTFKRLSQMKLLMVHANCSRPASKTVSLFSCSLFTGWPCELIIARTRRHSHWRNVKQLTGAYFISQQWKDTNNLKTTGLELCTRHTKMLQTVEEFWGLIPTIAVGNHDSSTSVCVDEGDMPTTKKLSGVLVLRRKAPCEPGASSWHRWCTTGCDQRPFQEGRLIISVSAFAARAFVDQGRVNNFLMGASISHNYCSYNVEVCLGYGYHSYSKKVHKHRVQWDPGGCQWNRLGVKPGFKKGGMSATQMLLHRPEVKDDDEGDPPGLLKARRGKRVDYPGLDQAKVVLANPGDCEKAIKTKVPRTKTIKLPDGGIDYDPASDVLFYRECLSVSFREGEVDNLELEERALAGQRLLVAAIDDHVMRRATNRGLLRPLVPVAYIEEDPFVHLRCLFIRAPRISGGAGGVSRLDAKLGARGGVCATVACQARSIALLVYDDTDTAEAVARSLINSFPSSVQLYDSSMFPFACVTARAAAAAGEELGLGGMIPPFFTRPEYMGRIVQLRGLDTLHCDARDIASSIHGQTDSDLQALIVHRRQGLVIAVFGTMQGARLQLRESESEDNWISVFGRKVTCELVCDPALFTAPPAPAPPLPLDELLPVRAAPYPGMHLMAIQTVHDLYEEERKACAPDDVYAIAGMLLKFAALSQPDLLRLSSFPDRAVLLLGIHPGRNWDYLVEAMSTYGGLDELVLCSPSSAALVIFKSWSSASKVRWETTDNCLSLGFIEGRPVPEWERAARIADEVRALLFRVDAAITSWPKV